eukprot:SAG22_NODE_267_length_13330_cov_19.960396_6_plen_331_part_00
MAPPAQQEDYRDAPPFFSADDAAAPSPRDFIAEYRTSPQQVSHWEQHGYVTLPGLLSPAQVQRWRDTLDPAVEARGRRMPMADDAQNTANSMYTQRCGLRLNCGRFNQLVLAASRVVGQVASELNRHPAGFRLYLDNVLIKEGWADPTKWHVDTVSFAFDSPLTSSFWIPLDDASETNGCLMFIEGSHRALLAAANPYEQRQPAGGGGGGGGGGGSGGGAIGGLFAQYPEFRQLKVKASPVPAGTAIVHNSLTAHAAGANMSHGRRRALVLHMMAEGHNHFNGNYLNPFLSVQDRERIRPGDVLDESWGEGGRAGFTFPLVCGAPPAPRL